MKGVLIAGFGAIGKTTVAKKYNNILDLESSNFKYIIDDKLKSMSEEERKGLQTRKLNKKFPENYYNAIIDNLYKNNIVLISMHKEILDKLKQNKIDYIVDYPKEDMLEEIIKRCEKRGNNKEFISGIKNAYYGLYPSKDDNILWLNKGEYLEQILKRMNLI